MVNRFLSAVGMLSLGAALFAAPLGPAFAAATLAASFDLSAGSDLGRPENATNEARIIQTGNANIASFAQEAGAGGGGNIIELTQRGSNNEASVMQTGASNRAVIDQLGSYNIADVVQSGSGNSMALSQAGNHNVFHATQTGNNNRIVGIQK